MVLSLFLSFARPDVHKDIIDSEMGYLGYDASEAYGITWKVRGFCSDL